MSDDHDESTDTEFSVDVPPPDPQSVDIRPAFHFFCEECAAENFFLPRAVEIPPDELEEVYRAEKELDPWESLPDDWNDFEIVEIPELIQCGECDAVFVPAADDEDLEE